MDTIIFKRIKRRQIRNVEPGDLFMFDDGGLAIRTEYGDDCYLLDTGEALGAHVLMTTVVDVYRRIEEG